MKFEKELIKIFAKKTSCSIQHGGCPCNTCFHAIEADFKHITWLILLGLRGDYSQKNILTDIKKELMILKEGGTNGK